jgi:modification methylase
MMGMPSGSVDMVLTSPPYNLGNTHHTGNKRHKAYDDNLPEEEYQEWQIKVLNECYRVLKDEGSLIYNHKNRIKKGVQITPYEWLLKTKFIIKQELVWFNGSQNFDKIRFYPMTERFYWLAKSPNTKLFNAASIIEPVNKSNMELRLSLNIFVSFLDFAISDTCCGAPAPLPVCRDAP